MLQNTSLLGNSKICDFDFWKFRQSVQQVKYEKTKGDLKENATALWINCFAMRRENIFERERESIKVW